MPRETASAHRASPASRVDLANDASSGERGVFRFDYAAGEFMTRHSAILHVAAGDLQVGSADAGDSDRNDTLTRRRNGIGTVAAKFQIAIEYQRAHKARPIQTKKPDARLPHPRRRRRSFQAKSGQDKPRDRGIISTKGLIILCVMGNATRFNDDGARSSGCGLCRLSRRLVAGRSRGSFKRAH
jgi:hypothetical protein